MNTLTITFTFDRSKLSTTELSDGLNDWIHGLATELGLAPNEDTGGYVGFDWTYSPEPAPEVRPKRAERMQAKDYTWDGE